MKIILLFIIGSTIEFNNQIDSRKLNFTYQALEWLTTQQGKVFTSSRPITQKEMLNSLERVKGSDEFQKRIISNIKEKTRREFGKRFYPNIELLERGWGVWERETKGDIISEIQVSTVGKIGKYFSSFVKVGIFNETGDGLDSFSLYDPIIDPTYILHTYDIQPVIGEKKLFDVRTDRAYGLFSFPWGSVEIGRDKVRYGPGYRSSLFLSGFSHPFNFLYNVRVRKKPFNFNVFNAEIEDSTDRKRIACQRIEFNLFNKIIFGLSEAVLHTRKDFLKYINPLDLYYITQRRGGSNIDNLIGAFDINMILTKGIRIYSEFVDDDFILFKGGASKYGIMGGFHITEPIRIEKSELRGELTYVPHWTYTHVSLINAYTSNGIPLGFWAGSDCIDGFLEFTKFLTPTSGVSLNLEHLVHGEGTLDEPWERERSENFKTPSGRPERRWICGLETFMKKGRTSFDTGVSYSYITNYKNKIDNRKRITAKAVISIKY